MTHASVVARFLKPRETVWGDGFAQESWDDVLSLRTWDDVDADLYARFCPRLLHGEAQIPGCLRESLRVCLVSRAQRLATEHGVGAVPSLSAIAPGAIVDAETRRAGGEKLSRPGPLSDLLRLATWPPNGVAVAQERSWLLYLDGIVGQIDRQALERARPAGTALFAYLTAIHPAYLWPTAAVSHERDAAAAWLGIVSRGRPAFMTEEVAQFFVDVITVQEGRIAIRDRQIALFAGMASPLKRLLRGAEARLRGEMTIIRHASTRRLWDFATRAAGTRVVWDEPDAMGSSLF